MPDTGLPPGGPCQAPSFLWSPPALKQATRAFRLAGDRIAIGAHLTVLRVAAPKIRSSSVTDLAEAQSALYQLRACHAGTSSCRCRAGRIAPRATDRPSPRQPSVEPPGTRSVIRRCQRNGPVGNARVEIEDRSESAGHHNAQVRNPAMTSVRSGVKKLR
jgi:hypothetical protein